MYLLNLPEIVRDNGKANINKRLIDILYPEELNDYKYN